MTREKKKGEERGLFRLTGFSSMRLHSFMRLHSRSVVPIEGWCAREKGSHMPDHAKIRFVVRFGNAIHRAGKLRRRPPQSLKMLFAIAAARGTLSVPRVNRISNGLTPYTPP